MDDSLSREEARFDIGSNAVVEAAAGTGKTTLLVDRILALILAGHGGSGIAIDRIVALTFTKKAAAEMKVRLASRLHEISSSLADRENISSPPFVQSLSKRFPIDNGVIKQRAELALENLERASIETLHAFAARILKLYPLEAGLSPSFEVDEGGVLNRIFESEWEKWLDGELGEASVREKEWLEILRFLKIKDLRALAEELCQEKIDLRKIEGASLEVALELESLAKKLDQIPKRNPAPRSNSPILSRLADLSGVLRALSKTCQESSLRPLPRPGDWPLKIPSWPQWPKAWEDDAEGKKIFERAKKIAAQSSPDRETLVRRALRLLLPFAREVRALYRRRGFVSFDGLLRDTRELLKNNWAVREEIKRSYDAFLVDEFQDTDPLQGEILFFLAEALGESASDWEKVRLGPGRLFVVGDPKQSIYRFRGADIAAYQEFIRRISKGANSKFFSLTRNFRSSPTVLSPINALFSKIMVEKNGLQAAHQNLSPAKTGGNSPAAEIITLIPSEKESWNSVDAQRAESRWMAEWIRDHCGPGKKLLYKDVAVLWRSSSGSSHLLEAFKEMRIPYAAQLESSLYDSQELVDFLNLLRVIDDPLDRVSLAGLLRSPLADVDDSELCRLSLEGSLSLGERRVKTGQKAQSGGIWNKVLRELQSEAGRLPLGDLIEKIFDQTAMIETAAAAHHGSQSASNLVKLARLAKSASDQEGLTLREFIERIAAESKAGKEAGESPLADDYWDCVRVLTIHKAKGLEFPVVMIPRISSKGRKVGTSGAMTDWKSSQAGFHVPSAKATSAAMALLKIKEEERLEYEAVRLLYVALTRAEDQVFLIGGKEFSRGSFADFLSLSEGIPTKEISPQTQFPATRERSAPENNSSLLPVPEIWAGLWKSRFKKANLERGVWRKSPTGEPQELIAQNKDSGLEEESKYSHPSETASLLGQLCHRALKKWDFKFPWDIKKSVEESAGALSLVSPLAPWADIVREATALLEGFSRSQAALEISQSEILGQEVPFSYNENGAVMRGVIDLVYRKENQIVIVDYKTGIPSEKEGSLSAESTRRYQEQAKIYGQAVEKTLLPGVVDFQLIFLREPERQIRWYNEKDARGLNIRAGNK